MQLKEAVILVVDDEPILLDIMSEWLRRAGCKVHTAKNGAEALQFLSDHRPDAMVSDIRMPVMDGISLLKSLYRISSASGSYFPKVIFISGFTDLTDREVYALGAGALLHKPIERDDLLDTLRRLLQSREEAWKESHGQSAPLLQLALPPVSVAMEQGWINFGRGGFCLHCFPPLRDGPVRFELKFASDNVRLAGYGIICWMQPGDNEIGVEILSLDDGCRDWVIQLIASLAPVTFIPATCRQQAVQQTNA
jgi:CheY-like chemotaxis protein